MIILALSISFVFVVCPILAYFISMADNSSDDPAHPMNRETSEYSSKPKRTKQPPEKLHPLDEAIEQMELEVLEKKQINEKLSNILDLEKMIKKLDEETKALVKASEEFGVSAEELSSKLYKVSHPENNQVVYTKEGLVADEEIQFAKGGWTGIHELNKTIDPELEEWVLSRDSWGSFYKQSNAACQKEISKLF